jgi:hypothetical protein
VDAPPVVRRDAPSARERVDARDAPPFSRVELRARVPEKVDAVSEPVELIKSLSSMVVRRGAAATIGENAVCTGDVSPLCIPFQPLEWVECTDALSSAAVASVSPVATTKLCRLPVSRPPSPPTGSPKILRVVRRRLFPLPLPLLRGTAGAISSVDVVLESVVELVEVAVELVVEVATTLAGRTVEFAELAPAPAFDPLRARPFVPHHVPMPMPDPTHSPILGLSARARGVGRMVSSRLESAVVEVEVEVDVELEGNGNWIPFAFGGVCVFAVGVCSPFIVGVCTPLIVGVSIGVGGPSPSPSCSTCTGRLGARERGTERGTTSSSIASVRDSVSDWKREDRVRIH